MAITDVLTIKMLHEQQSQTAEFLQKRANNPQLIFELILRLLVMCQLSDSIAVKNMMEYLAAYDISSGTFSLTEVAYENRYFYEDMMRLEIPIEVRKNCSELTIMIMQTYCSTIIPLQEMSQSAASLWLERRLHDVCFGRISLELHKNLLRHAVYSKRTSFKKKLLEGDIPLQY